MLLDITMKELYNMKIIYMQRTIDIISEEKWLEIQDEGMVKLCNEEPYIIIDEEDVQL